MNRITFGLCFVALLNLGSPADCGVDLNAEQEPNEYLLSLLERSKSNDPHAMFQVGQYYHYNGDETVRDLKRAAYWYERAAEYGHAESQDYLGKFYSGGVGGFPVSCEKSIYWYSRSAESGYRDAWENLAWKLSTCEEPSLRDGQRALRILRDHAADLGEDAGTLDTMAAAYAEVGQFETAMTLEFGAIALLEHRGQNERIEAFKQRLRLYSSGKTWRGASFEKPDAYR